MPPRSTPDDRARQKRTQILDAALEVFSAQGYAAARLDDVAAKAGVAKGTLYLHFTSKQDLFEQLIAGAVAPVLGTVAAAAADPDRPTADLLRMIYELVEREVLRTRRKDILRLVLTEGHRFPAIAAFYHREVVSRGLDALQRLARRAEARGELSCDAVVRFPHLLIAPVLAAVLWDGLFAPFAPLDIPAMLDAQRQLVFPQIPVQP